MRLGHNDESIHRFMQNTIAQITTKSLSADELTVLALKTGEIGVRTMALLDKANTSSYGNPEITHVNIGTGTRPGILISGHDLHDLEELLEQTKDSGVDVYTHGEMLPAHYYPAFKKYTHFAGNYGNAWWKQREEFTSFNGPILFTTNCIVPPLPNATYKERMFTTNSTGYPGCKHITADEKGHKDYTEIIETAKQCAAPTEIEHGEIVGGFAHNQVLQLADKVVEAVKSGAIRKFIVMAGCDGRMRSRDYYTTFAIRLAMKSFTPQEGVGRAIIVITDGENHEGGAVEAAQEAAEKGMQVFVLGVGSPDGSPIPAEDGSNNFRRDKDGNVIVTRLNEQMCQEIAKAGNGMYIRVDNTNSAEKVLNNEITKLSKADVESQVYTEFDEQFQALAWLVLILLVVEMLILERKNPLFKNVRLFK